MVKITYQKKSEKVKDCFEKVNRATFAFNQGLDEAIFEPVAKAYRALPSPLEMEQVMYLIIFQILVTIPNNILQGELKKAGDKYRKISCKYNCWNFRNI